VRLSLYVCGAVGSGDGAPVTKNFHWPTFPVPVRPAANLAINAASFDDTVPLPLESDTNLWFWLTNGTEPETPCATLAASFELIAVFGPPGLVHLIV
jgi:hypothetical protein